MATYRRFRIQRKYINGQPTDVIRLGEQIDSTNYPSLEECERGSGCTDLEYRWVDVKDVYVCEGTTKYTLQKKQQKCVTETEWVDVYPYEQQIGTVVETNSTDCGYVPTSIKLYTTTDGNGNIDISPSKSIYNYNDVVTINTNPNTDYDFSCYYYGSTNAYGQTTTSSQLMLTMTHDWYVSAAFKYSPTNYNLYTYIVGNGTISVVPSQLVYLYGDKVEITATPSDGYSFQGYEYGSTSAFGSANLNRYMELSMTNDYYVRAKFVSASVTPTGGSLYYKYINGTNSWYQWMSSMLTIADNNGVNAKYIADYGNVITSIGSFALADNLLSVSFPACERIGYRCFYGCSSLREVNIPNCSFLDSYAFWNCIKLTSINLPNMKIIGSYAFGGTKLTTVYLPLCVSIGEDGFRQVSLTHIDLPKCEYLESGAFIFCSYLSEANLPVCSHVGQGAFYRAGLVNAYLPNASYIGVSAFRYCESLESINIQKAEYIDAYALYGCLKLKEIDIPLCYYISDSAFENCELLETANVPKCSTFGNGAFSNCRALKTVNIGNVTSVPKIYGSNLFSDCINLVSIYVPSSLLNSFINASGWSIWSTKFVGV